MDRPDRREVCQLHQRRANLGKVILREGIDGEAVDWACAEAVRQTLGDFPLRWSYSEPLGERYREEDGEAMWARVVALLGG